MKRITVFCGSSNGTQDIFQLQATALGKKLAQQGIGIVYGGAKVGLMGAVADGALSANGEVIGVLPHFLSLKELAHPGLTNLILVNSMHERKIKMYELSDGTIALPGGFGTLEEFFEILTWGQLGLHKKPVALLNIDGFYNPLLELLQVMVNKGFLKSYNQKMLLVSPNIEELLDMMRHYTPPNGEKWIVESQV